jgi:integrase
MTEPKRKRITYTKQDGTTATRKAPGKRQHKLLTEEIAQHLECNRNKQYFVWDKGVKGLHVLVNKKGTRTYRSLWYYAGSSKPHSRSLGRVGVLDLEEARKLCLADQKAAAQGIDPKSEERVASDAFEDVVNEYVEREQIGRKRNATAKEVRRALLKDCAAFKSRPIASIRPAEIEKLLERIRDGDAEHRGRPYLANKLWGYLGSLFRWCVKKRKLAASPMVSIDRPWEGAEPRTRVFSDDELKQLWHCKLEPNEAAFLKLLILTGKRKGALAAMRWGEINDAWDWTPPPGNKNKRVHPLPLPKLAQRILIGLKPKDVKADNQVFPSPQGGKNGVMHVASRLQGRVQKLTGIEDFFPHAIRHTVETRLAELRVPPHVRDLLLDHAPTRGSGKDYDHWEYRDEKSEAMEKWAGHVEGLVVPEGVTALR